MGARAFAIGGGGGVVVPDVGSVLELLNDLARQGVVTGGVGVSVTTSWLPM